MSFRNAKNQVRLDIVFGMTDVELRFARTYLGPAWNTLLLMIIILAMGPIYGNFIGSNTTDFTKNLAISLAIWQGISAMLNESCAIHRETRNIFAATGLLPLIGLLRLYTRNAILFYFNCMAVVCVYLIMDIEMQASLLWIYPIFIAISLLLLGPITLLSSLSIKFPDISLIVQSSLTVLFFISPIVWQILDINLRGISLTIIELNPFTHIMETSRSVLFSEALNPSPLVPLLAASGVCLIIYTLNLIPSKNKYLDL